MRIVGRLAGMHGSKVLFSGTLAEPMPLSELKMTGVNTSDEWSATISCCEVEARVAATHPLKREPPFNGLVLFRIQSIVWAPHRPDTPGFMLPFSTAGPPTPRRGRGCDPGMYGWVQFLVVQVCAHRGAGADAHDLSDTTAGLAQCRVVGSDLHRFVDNLEPWPYTLLQKRPTTLV